MRGKLVARDEAAINREDADRRGRDRRGGAPHPVPRGNHPFEIDDSKEVGDQVRLKYRYLDLRRPSMQKNLMLRHRVTGWLATTLTSRVFLEIETPMLTKSTPEGARDYLVPSRVHPGKFYAAAAVPAAV